MDLTAFLVDGGYLSLPNLQKAQEKKSYDSRKPLGEILIENDLVHKSRLPDLWNSLIPFLAKNPDYIHESRGLISFFSAEASEGMYPGFLRTEGIFPIGTVYTGDIENLYVISKAPLTEENSSRVRERFGIKSIRSVGGNSPILFERLLAEISVPALEEITQVSPRREDKSQLVEAASEEKIIRLVESYVGLAIKYGASDLHFEIGEKLARARYRIDGELYRNMAVDLKDYSSVVARIKVISNLDLGERRLPQDGKFYRRFREQGDYDIRVSILPTLHGEKVVMRFLSRKMIEELDLGSLGMDPEIYQTFRGMMDRPNGIILVTGPTGSGKSTTLYAALKEKLKRNPHRNFHTVEDPIEYYLQGVNHTQVHDEYGLTFPAVLRSLLRQDPDVILVGEIRDKETAQLASKAAQTGHLVLSTLHTNDAAGAIGRLIDLEVAKSSIAQNVIGVVAQRLLKKICENCREEVKDFDPQVFIKEGITNGKAYHGKGCNACHDRGFSGRTAIYEIMPLLTTSNNISDDIKVAEWRSTHGTPSLRHAGLIKVNAGLVSLEDVLEETM